MIANRRGCDTGDSAFQRCVPITIEGQQGCTIPFAGIVVEEDLSLLHADVPRGDRRVHLHYLREQSAPCAVGTFHPNEEAVCTGCDAVVRTDGLLQCAVEVPIEGDQRRGASLTGIIVPEVLALLHLDLSRGDRGVHV